MMCLLTKFVLERYQEHLNILCYRYQSGETILKPTRVTKIYRCLNLFRRLMRWQEPGGRLPTALAKNVSNLPVNPQN
ncbi:hypothetical protein BD310DRAFT_923157, partial [Dichomitus squalens]